MTVEGERVRQLALPPATEGDRVLADRAYVDVAPVDLARSLGSEVVRLA